MTGTNSYNMMKYNAVIMLKEILKHTYCNDIKFLFLIMIMILLFLLFFRKKEKDKVKRCRGSTP